MLFCFSANAGEGKLAKDLKGRKSAVDVIVQYAATTSEKHHNTVRGKGGQLKGELKLIKAPAYTVDAAALDDLAADPDVVYISPIVTSVPHSHTRRLP